MSEALALDRTEVGSTPFAASPSEATTDPYRAIGDVLEATRCYLAADAAYVGEIKGDRQIFHWIAGDAASFGLRPGASIPLAGTLCHGVVTNRMPSLVNDTQAEPFARELDITTRAGIRAYVGIPIVLPDGSLFGTLCAVNHKPGSWHDGREARFAQTMSRLAADQIARIKSDATHHYTRAERTHAAMLAAEAVRIALQPIVALRTRVVVGEEALMRFSDGRPPTTWLDEAWSGGFGPHLELAAIRTALATLPGLPDDVYLSVNSSPLTLLSPELDDVLTDIDLARIVIEITEHHAIDDYDDLRRRMNPFRRRGLRLAVDDACAGFASLSHVLQLRPDIIKLDVSLIRDIEHDNARQALAASLLNFGSRINAAIVAEGVQTEKQVEVLSVLGISFGQGYLLGQPGNGLGRRLPAIDLQEGWPNIPMDPRTVQHAR